MESGKSFFVGAFAETPLKLWAGDNLSLVESCLVFVFLTSGSQVVTINFILFF